MDSFEIDEGTDYVGYQEAFRLICSNVHPVGVEEMPLGSCVGRMASEDLVARVSYPSGDISLKDGFAVRSKSVATASVQSPVCLRVIGSVFPGSKFEGEIRPGSAVKVTSGALIPCDLNAVVSGEFCEEVSPQEVFVKADAEEGRNVLRTGEEIRAGATIAKRGEVLLPGRLGLGAAAGITRARVYRRPKAAVVGVGDEVVAPGGHLRPGHLYASNLVTMGAWLTSFGVPFDSSVVKDNRDAIQKELLRHLPSVDVILTSGGAWGSERDLVVGVLDALGWQEIFHHVRMGPGKGIAFGIWDGKPVFCLPGGPASNEMAFVQLALPGILHMGGQTKPPLQTVFAKLTENLKGRHRAWTEFKEATLSCDSQGNYTVNLYKNRSRLQAIANANCLICIPEGRESLSPGEMVPVQILVPCLAGIEPGI